MVICFFRLFFPQFPRKNAHLIKGNHQPMCLHLSVPLERLLPERLMLQEGAWGGSFVVCRRRPRSHPLPAF